MPGVAPLRCLFVGRLARTRVVLPGRAADCQESVFGALASGARDRCAALERRGPPRLAGNVVFIPAWKTLRKSPGCTARRGCWFASTAEGGRASPPRRSLRAGFKTPVGISAGTGRGRGERAAVPLGCGGAGREDAALLAMKTSAAGSASEGGRRSSLQRRGRHPQQPRAIMTWPGGWVVCGLTRSTSAAPQSSG
jgi:hypothetical protein